MTCGTSGTNGSLGCFRKKNPDHVSSPLGQCVPSSKRLQGRKLRGEKRQLWGGQASSLLWELKFSRCNRGIFEENTGVQVREKASCKHRPGGEKIPSTVTGTIMFPVPLTSPPFLPVPTQQGKTREPGLVPAGPMTDSQQAPGRERGRALKFNQVGSCKFDIGLRILSFESPSCDLKSHKDLKLPPEARWGLSPHMEKV